MKRAKIAIIDDDPATLELHAHILQLGGYDVVQALDAAAGLEIIAAEAPDLILLDLVMPVVSGFEVCRALRRDGQSGAPIIIVSGRSEESDVVLGLELGADDFVIKPFSPQVLLARVLAVLRRSRQIPPEAPERIELGGVALDSGRHEVKVGGAEVPFTPTEFRLLWTLADHPGQVHTRGQLIRRAINGEAVIPRTIDVHIRAIRSKLGKDHDLIETVRGVGYRLRGAEP